MPILSVLLQIRAFGFTASHRTAHEVQVLAGLGLGSGPFLRTHYALHVERLFLQCSKEIISFESHKSMFLLITQSAFHHLCVSMCVSIHLSSVGKKKFELS